jgi:hypothetical protein
MAVSSCENFVTHEALGDLLAGYETSYPDVARRLVVGQSFEGRELWALVVSAEPDIESPEPEVRIIGGIHGNECLTVEMVLSIIGWVLEGYGHDEQLTNWVEGGELVFVPLVNPDGYMARPARRRNANGVDLNRNLGFAWVGANGRMGEGSRPFSEVETRALRALGQDRSFVLGLSYHTKANYVNGPWNFTPHPPPDAALIDRCGTAYGGDSPYRVVFGWDWFTITGDHNDWSLGTRGTFDWTIELTSDSELNWQVHEAGLRQFIPFAFRGLKGKVEDGRDGSPVAARLELEPWGAPIYTDPEVGDFHRPLLPGSYRLRVSAPGYESAEVSDVVVTDEEVTVASFALKPQSEQETLECPAFAVTAMTLPRVIENDSFSAATYGNRTLPWAALGGPDGRYYSLSPGGTVTLDLGPGYGVLNGPGPDLLVVSGTGSDDEVRVLVAYHEDGPFVEVGRGRGTFMVDVIPWGPWPLRYVRLEDLGPGPFNEAAPGYDVDAVVAFSCGPGLPPGPPDPPNPTGPVEGPLVSGSATGCSAAGGFEGFVGLRWLDLLRW